MPPCTNLTGHSQRESRASVARLVPAAALVGAQLLKDLLVEGLTFNGLKVRLGDLGKG